MFISLIYKSLEFEKIWKSIDEDYDIFKQWNTTQ